MKCVTNRNYQIIFCNTPDLIIIICPSKSFESIGVKFSTSRVQLLPVILGQLSAERVDGDDEGSAVGFKLKCRIRSLLIKTEARQMTAE